MTYGLAPAAQVVQAGSDRRLAAAAAAAAQEEAVPEKVEIGHSSLSSSVGRP
jgi:hypothetical protein